MDLDIKKAFLSPFSEKRWYMKLIFPFIVIACNLMYHSNLHISKTVMLFTVPIALFLNIVLIGFFIQFQHNEIDNKEFLLPILNKKVKNYFFWGLSFIGIMLCYLFFFIGSSFCFSGLLYLGETIKILTYSIIYIALFLFIIAILFSEGSYSDDFCFRKAIDFEHIFKLMSQVKLEILFYIFILIPFVALINIFSEFRNIMIIFSPFVIVIMQLIIANLNAQVYKIAKKKLENTVDINKETLIENNNFES